MMLLKKDKMIVKYILLFFERRCSLARCCRSQTALPIAAVKQPCPLQQPNSLARAL